MATVARLTADLTANTSRFEAGMKRASASMKGFGELADKAGKAAGIGILAATAALGALAIRQAQVIDATSKLSATLGTNLREFQALSLVAEEAGVDQDGLAKAITKTQQVILQAADGSKSYVDALARIGLKSKDLITLSPDQQFIKIAEALATIENPTVRTATALEIFGKQGRAIIGLLPELSAKIDEARAFNDKFNISLTETDAAKVEEANDAFGRIGIAISGLGNTLAIEFAPLVTAASNALLNAGVDGQTFGKMVKLGMEIGATAVDVVRVTLLDLRSVLLTVQKSLLSFVLDASTSLFNLAEAMESLPFMENTGKAAKAYFLEVNQGAQQAAAGWKERRAELDKEYSGFVSSYEKLTTLQEEADRRASVSVKARKASGIVGIDDDESPSKKASSGMKEYARSATEAKKAQIDLNGEIASSFEGVTQQLQNGAKVADVFRDKVISALGSIAEQVISSGISGLFSGGKSGLLSGALGAVGSGIGGLFKSLLPSFDVGSYNVPKDMTANIHKGEMIIPAREAAQIRAGGSGGEVSIVQNISIGTGVSQAVRQEVAKMLPDLKRAAISGVEDARLRGANI